MHTYVGLLVLSLKLGVIKSWKRFSRMRCAPIEAEKMSFFQSPLVCVGPTQSGVFCSRVRVALCCLLRRVGEAARERAAAGLGLGRGRPAGMPMAWHEAGHW